MKKDGILFHLSVYKYEYYSVQGPITIHTADRQSSSSKQQIYVHTLSSSFQLDKRYFFLFFEKLQNHVKKFFLIIVVKTIY